MLKAVLGFLREYKPMIMMISGGSLAVGIW